MTGAQRGERGQVPAAVDAELEDRTGHVADLLVSSGAFHVANVERGGLERRSSGRSCR